MATPTTSAKLRESISATRVIRNVDRWRADLWPLWLKERQLTCFFNSEALPIDDEEADDGTPVSMGLGYRYLAKPRDTLLDSILMKPGFIQSSLDYPQDARLKRKIECAVDVEANLVAHERHSSLIRSIAGRGLITGRAFCYRLSQYAIQWHQGRLLHDIDDCDDIHSDSFREFAIMGRMTLSELDDKISNARDVGTGWNRTAMRNLKKWILQTTSTEKNLRGQKLEERVDAPFDSAIDHEPLEVCWYWRKNGNRHEITGKEKIDLYCCSHYNSASKVALVDNGDNTAAAYLDLQTDTSGNQLLYHVRDAFQDIGECLIPLLLDSRMDGEAKMAQVSGVGQIMTSRLLPMEQLAVSVLEGVCWAVQPNYTCQSATDEAMLRKLIREGIGPGDVLPQGLVAVAKNNAISGVNGALQLLNLLGVSADQDAATGEISPMQQSHPELKSIGEKIINQMDAATARRAGHFYRCVDKLADSILRTLTRPMAMWQKSDPAYYDVKLFQGSLLVKCGVTPDMYSPIIMSGRCRRLAMEGDRAQTVQKAAQFQQLFGNQISPEGHHFLAKEAARAVWDDSTAELLLPDTPPVDIGQQMIAVGQESMCLVSLTLPQRNPSDNPMLHALSHLKALGARIQVAQQAGSWTPMERQGAALLAQHVAEDIPGLPPSQAEQAGQGLQQMARVMASLPVAGATSEMQLKQADAQRKQQELILKMEREHNLVSDRQGKLEIQQQKLMLAMHDSAVNKTSAKVRDATMLAQAAQSALDEPETTPAGPVGAMQ